MLSPTLCTFGRCKQRSYLVVLILDNNAPESQQMLFEAVALTLVAVTFRDFPTEE
jgi:hypothetical protein